jgi:glycosyltransferase involved in cell wall biosynthesis
MKIMPNRIKYTLKNIAHRVPFIPYRKRSKRYAVWNRLRERNFLLRIDKIYKKEQMRFDEVFVSIVMPVYNRSYSVKTAINSVIAQSHEKWELLIIDDGSTDNLQETLSAFREENRICVFYEQHKGVSHARNVGIQNANGKYLFYLDADNVWRYDFLRNMIVCLEQGDIDCCYCGVEIENDNKKIVGYYGEKFNWLECLELNFIDINSFGHQTAIVKNGIRFNEELRRYVDWDFLLSITLENTIAYAPFLGVRYYDGTKGNRITTTECVGNEKTHLQEIRHSHSKQKDKYRGKTLSWRDIVKSGF